MEAIRNTNESSNIYNSLKKNERQIKAAILKISSIQLNGIKDEEGNVLRKADLVDFLDTFRDNGIYEKEYGEKFDDFMYAICKITSEITFKEKRFSLNRVVKSSAVRLLSSYQEQYAMKDFSKITYTMQGKELKAEDINNVLGYLKENGYPTNNYTLFLHALRRYASETLIETPKASISK